MRALNLHNEASSNSRKRHVMNLRHEKNMNQVRLFNEAQKMGLPPKAVRSNRQRSKEHQIDSQVQVDQNTLKESPYFMVTKKTGKDQP